jgi:hypothetical protein
MFVIVKIGSKVESAEGGREFLSLTFGGGP